MAPTLTVEAHRMDDLAASQEESRVIDNLSAEFASFLGADARSLISGLRYGTPVTLTGISPGTPRGGGAATTTTTINPPTGKMEFSDLFIALALARAQLATLGLGRPTPEQLRAVLVGGAIHGYRSAGIASKIVGILTMRSRKMGWGLIAENLGLKLGPVVSSLRSTNYALMGGAASPKEEGITSGVDQPVGASLNRGW